MLRALLLAGLAVASVVESAHAASFRRLEEPAGGYDPFVEGLSDDGQWATGGDFGYGIVWNVTTGAPSIPPLGNGTVAVTDANADGSVLVGERYAFFGDQPSQALRWTGDGLPQDLGTASPSVVSPHVSGVSGDGSIVVGTSRQFGVEGQGAFRWTEGTGMVPLGAGSNANDISLDGTTIVGSASLPGGGEVAVRWVHGGSAQSLGFFGDAAATDADGSAIVGSTANGDSYLWTAGGLVPLGSLPGGSGVTRATGVSNGGGVVVGFSHDATGERAFVWTPTAGIRDLQDYLENVQGLDLAGWTLTGADAISGDGHVIVGHGSDPDGVPSVWAAVIPEPSTVLLLGVGLASIGASRRR